MPDVQAYICSNKTLPGSTTSELITHARQAYHKIQKQTPRRIPYVRSRYFGGQKIFINIYWDHLRQKSLQERTRRLRFYVASLELIAKTKQHPMISYAKDKSGVIYHRFLGQTQDGHEFYVQISQNKKGRYDFMSAFPVNNGK